MFLSTFQKYKMLILNIVKGLWSYMEGEVINFSVMKPVLQECLGWQLSDELRQHFCGLTRFPQAVVSEIIGHLSAVSLLLAALWAAEGLHLCAASALLEWKLSCFHLAVWVHLSHDVGASDTERRLQTRGLQSRMCWAAGGWGSVLPCKALAAVLRLCLQNALLVSVRKCY